jgi:cytochrome b involved in lipid metabolism
MTKKFEDLKIFTMEEVKEKKSKGRHIILIDGRILDVTDFASSHPGGTTILTEGGSIFFIFKTYRLG